MAFDKHLLPYWTKHSVTAPTRDEFISGKNKQAKSDEPGFITKTAVSGFETTLRVAEQVHKGVEKVSKEVGRAYQYAKLTIFVSVLWVFFFT